MRIAHAPLFAVTFAILSGALASTGFTQESPSPAPGTNTNSIRWHLPGSFDHARARARDEGRLLLIKGISFGIDEVGATCATKGKW